MPKTKFIKAIESLEEEKGIEKQVILDALSEALEKSYKKNYLGPESVVRVDINDKTGKIRLYEIKTVVDNLEDEDDYINDDYQIELDDAREINPKCQVGDEIVNEVSPDVFGRLAAVQTKQILRQKIREAEKDALYNEYIDKKDDIITGVVDRVESKFAIINIGRTSALLPLKQQIPGEKLSDGLHLKVYVCDVEKNPKGTHISVSRTDPGLVKRLFEMEVPEIYNGIVEIMSVSREPGDRSKIAVYSDNPDIDAVGSCVGKRGTRVNNVVKELNGEMIDIVEWDKDPAKFVINALAPASVTRVEIDEKSHTAYVVVPDNQLSLAIGKRGQNAKLAVRLTGWKIDIKSESEAKESGFATHLQEEKEFEEEFAREMTDQDNDETFDEDISRTNEQDGNEIEETSNETSKDSGQEEESQDQSIVEDEEDETLDDENVYEEDNDVDNDDTQESDDDYDDYDDNYDYDDEYYDDDYDDGFDYDPKYDEDIDYDQYDEYYDK